LSTLFSTHAAESAHAHGADLSLAAVALNRSVQTASHLSVSIPVDGDRDQSRQRPAGAHPNGGRVVEVRDGKVFEHVAATIEATKASRCSRLLPPASPRRAVNSDGALVLDGGAPGGHLRPGGGTHGPGERRAVAFARQENRKVGVQPGAGPAAGVEPHPPDYTAIAAGVGGETVSVADANGGEGRVWLSDVALDSSRSRTWSSARTAAVMRS
jgi:hypothetical protein